VTAEGAALLDVAGLLVPPLLLGALAGRLLGIEVQRGPGALSGLAGSALEVATSKAVTDGESAAESFIAFDVYAIYSATRSTTPSARATPMPCCAPSPVTNRGHQRQRGTGPSRAWPRYRIRQIR
jgi:hypothetical protein